MNLRIYAAPWAATGTDSASEEQTLTPTLFARTDSLAVFALLYYSSSFELWKLGLADEAFFLFLPWNWLAYDSVNNSFSLLAFLPLKRFPIHLQLVRACLPHLLLPRLSSLTFLSQQHFLKDFSEPYDRLSPNLKTANRCKEYCLELE